MRQSVARSQRVTLHVVVLEETRSSIKCRIEGHGVKWLARIAVRGGHALRVGFSGRINVTAGHMEDRA